MPRQIAAGFSQLRTNLEITDLQAETVSTRHTNVRDAVEAEMSVLESFLVGSYGRDTMIAPLKKADIDVFVVLSAEHFKGNNPTSLLDEVREVLRETYPKTPAISKNGQAVTITFSDFRVDVVPAFNRKGGGYLIPTSRTDEWISTNPPAHDDALTKANKAHTGDLVPLIKMLKGWNRNIGDGFRGFYLELLATNVLNGMTIPDFPSGVRFVFDKGREKVKYKQKDPAGFGDQINPLDSVKTVEDAVSRFETAYGRAVKAERLAANGDIEAAFTEWRKIFGEYFPTYG